MPYVNTITPQRILGYLDNLKRDLDRLETGNCTASIVANILNPNIESIEFQARYMIEDAYRDAIEEGDSYTLGMLFRYNPEYRFRAAIALTKIQLENANKIAVRI